MKTEKDIVYSNISPLDKLDIYFAEEEKGVMVYFHGGGFTAGDKYDPHVVEIAMSFAKKGYTFVNVDYSLYPNTKFPSYLKEGAQALKYVFKRFINKDIYVSGTSAGAYLSMMLCFNKQFLLDEGINPLMVKGWIFESGQPTSHFNIMNIEKGLDPMLQRIDEMAPLYYVDKTVDISPALFILYDNDLPNRYAQNQLLISSVLTFNNTLELDQILLKGSHCAGSSNKDTDGEYLFVKESIKWIERK